MGWFTRDAPEFSSIVETWFGRDQPLTKQECQCEANWKLAGIRVLPSGGISRCLSRADPLIVGTGTRCDLAAARPGKPIPAIIRSVDDDVGGPPESRMRDRCSNDYDTVFAA